MKLFISYRRKSWPFTHQLASELRKWIQAEIFIDYQSVDQTDFESSILRNLRESDAVLLIVSEYTFASDRIYKDFDWVHREIREALLLNKPIVVVFIEGQNIPSDIPEDIHDIRRMQGVNFYPEYFDAAIKRLADFIAIATPLELADSEKPKGKIEESPTVNKATLGDAIKLLEDGYYDKAIFLLEELRESGYKSRFISLDEVLSDAQRYRDDELQREEALEAYKDISVLVRSKVTLDRARKAWITFQEEFPDFTDDPENLADRLKPKESIQKKRNNGVAGSKPDIDNPNPSSKRRAEKQSVESIPDFDSMTFYEAINWLETLGKRQGATEGFTTSADMDIAYVDPSTAVIDEPGYIPYGQEFREKIPSPIPYSSTKRPGIK